MTDSPLDAWRERIQAHERDSAALGGGHGHGHGHGHSRRAFERANRPLDLYRSDDPVLNALYATLKPNAEVLDVGGGAGRFALPLATKAKRVTVVEPSADSVEMLESRAAEAGIVNIAAINETWEEAEAPMADIVFCSLVLHHVSEPEPFIDKMERCARDAVVLVEMMETPGALEVPFFERVHGSAPTPLPGLPDVLNLLWGMDIFPDVAMLTAEPAVLDRDRDAALDQLRRRLGVHEGDDADRRLLAAADELLEATPAGFVVRGISPRRQALVSWRPADR